MADTSSGTSYLLDSRTKSRGPDAKDGIASFVPADKVANLERPDRVRLPSSGSSGNIVSYVCDPKKPKRGRIALGGARDMVKFSGSRTMLKRRRPSPLAALAQWLDMDSDRERVLFWLEMKTYVIPSSLPNILLEHLHRTKYPIVSPIAFSAGNYSDISGDSFKSKSIILS